MAAALAERDDPQRQIGCADPVTGSSSRCATLVAMVQTADLAEGDNDAWGGWLYGPGFRTFLAEREMCPASVVISQSMPTARGTSDAHRG
jgi:hypothetical protein